MDISVFKKIGLSDKEIKVYLKLLEYGAVSVRSLAELTEKTTGAALPIDAIFAWLQGRDVSTTGWTADLSAISQGSLSARRTTPSPEVTLRIKLDQ